MKKNNKKQITLQRFCNLIDSLISNQDLVSTNNIDIAKKIITKYKLKIPYEYKILFCKNCKNFIIPGKNSRIRIGRSNIKSIRITCKICNHTYRKIIQKVNLKS
ncbi:MAG TPA: RNase P subunit [Verrucomicrobiae bacterium]|nr:RNase P subunit [Verrucomicrobiae bacterium]